MAWEIIKINSNSGNNIPFVSIGRGQLDFNASACKLVGDKGQYNYAQFLKNKENGKPVIGVRFLERQSDDSIEITRKKQNGKTISGMTIRNKGTINELFGKDGSNDGMIRYNVELVEPNLLKINI